MSELLDLIIGMVIFFALYAFFSPLLYKIGKLFLRFITFNRFPPDHPDDKTISNTVGAGVLVLILLFIIYVIVKNYFFK